MTSRWVIVTGGSRGLGADIIEHLLNRDYAVATCSRARSPMIDGFEADKSLAGRFFWQACQIGEPGEADRFVRAATERAGGSVHGLVNNAAIAMSGLLATFPNVDSERLIRVNLLGSLEMARAASKMMMRNKDGGRIINISSIIATRGYRGLTAYSASKAGMDGMTRALARELGRHGITVNSVAPGYLDTRMSSDLNEKQLAQIRRRTPLGRLGTGQDVVGLIAFLLSEQAAFITGQTILVDGGIST